MATFKEARWFASLSNGENAVEDKGKFEEVAGELSPWLKLREYCEDNDLSITSLQIRQEGRTHTLPSNDPKFGGESPIGYNYFRKVSEEFDNTDLSRSRVVERYICIQAIYEDYTQSLWVDEMGRKESWVSVEEKGKEKYRPKAFISKKDDKAGIVESRALDKSVKEK